jgi:hypothetical protein
LANPRPHSFTILLSQYQQKAIFIAKNLYLLKILAPSTNTTIHTTNTMKNSIFAMAAAPEAMSVNPNIAAMIATIKKINDHLSIMIII